MLSLRLMDDPQGVTLDSGRGKRRLEKTKARGFLEGRLQESRMLGASAATPSNDRLLREFEDEVLTRERTLESSAKTQRDPRTREIQVDSS